MTELAAAPLAAQCHRGLGTQKTITADLVLPLYTFKQKPVSTSVQLEKRGYRGVEISCDFTTDGDNVVICTKLPVLVE